MHDDAPTIPTPTVDTLVGAWRAGQLSRREFRRRTSVLGVSATGAAVVLERNPWSS